MYIVYVGSVHAQIQVSGQRKEVFDRYQRESGIEVPLVIPLHSNVRWGSAALMCDRAFKLREVRLCADLTLEPS